MRSTLKDVAKLAKVNFTLVSKYLSGNPQARMTPETRQRIENALRELDYHPSAAARTLRSGHSRSVGLLLGSLTNSYCGHFADHMFRTMRNRGYQLLISLAQAGEGDSALRELVARGVDGLISVFDSIDDREFLRCPPCPVVVSDRSYPTISEVNLDLDEAMHAALSHFAGQGKRRVHGLFFPNSRWNTVMLNACVSSGVEPDIRMLPFDETKRREELRGIVGEKPEAIFTNGWQTATMMLEVLDTTGMAPDAELMFVATCTGPFLADRRIAGVVHSSAVKLADELVATLIDRIQSGDATPLRKHIEAEFIPARSREFTKLYSKNFHLT